MAEATPLLHDIDETASHIDSTYDEFEGQTRLSAKRPAYFKTLSIIVLVLSTLAVALLIANYIIAQHAPIGYSAWWTSRVTANLAKWVIVSVVFSFINVLVNFPILLNVIVDVVLISGIIAGVVHLFEAFPNSSWCAIQRGYPWPGNPNPVPTYPHPKCETWKLVVKILMGVAGSFGAIIALLYLALLGLRVIVIIRTKFWKRPIAWSFPTGQISFAVSIKLSKQESATTSHAGQSAEDSGSGHGPVHL